MMKPSIFRYEGHNYLVPFLIISSLFFMWGFAHGILEVLNPHFQESFHISKAMSALTQAAVYGAYFLMALPAGWIIRKWGYRRGVITGLILFGIGALMFIPGSRNNSFYFFVLSLFVIGYGLTCLETSAIHQFFIGRLVGGVIMNYIQPRLVRNHGVYCGYYGQYGDCLSHTVSMLWGNWRVCVIETPRSSLDKRRIFESPRPSFQRGLHRFPQAPFPSGDRGCNRPPVLGTAAL